MILSALVLRMNVPSKVTLSAEKGGERIRVWQNPNRTGQVTLPKTWDAGAQPGALYIEGVAVIEPLLEDTNPYLQVEAAKELFKNDARRGEDALKALLSADSPIARGEAFRQLHKIGKATNTVPAPMPDERYELLLSIIQGN